MSVITATLTAIDVITVLPNAYIQRIASSVVISWVVAKKRQEGWRQHLPLKQGGLILKVDLGKIDFEYQRIVCHRLANGVTLHMIRC